LKTVRLGAPFEKRFGQPYRVTHRADLHSALLTVSKDHKNLKIRMGAEKSIADFSAEDTVIAADGIWSNMRQAMFPQAKVVALPDQIYRALVDIPKSSETDLANVNLWLFPGGHVVSYLVCGGKKLNIVAVTQGSTPKDHFAKAADHLQTIIAIPTEWLIWPGAYVEPMPQWHKDNVILIGDAAHGTLPYLAQGAAMALEDATALAQTGNDFSAFERLRRPRCLNLHGQSLHNGRIYHLNSYAAQLRNFALAAMPEQSFLSQLSWLYGP
jgi:salicylate hydroxylase